MIRAQFLSLALAAYMTCVPAFAGPPPATQVKADVHAASTLATELLNLTPTTGATADESAVAQMVGAQGLGEVMGWGQNYFDAVEPAIVQQIVKHFQAAFTALEGFEATGLTYAQVVAVVTNLKDHFKAISTAVTPAEGAAGADDQHLREVRALSKLLAFHIKELPGSPLVTEPRVGVALALRTIRGGAHAVVTGLQRFPQLAEKVKADLTALEAIATNPPACAAQPTKACVAEIARKAQPHVDRIEKALK